MKIPVLSIILILLWGSFGGPQNLTSAQVAPASAPPRESPTSRERAEPKERPNPRTTRSESPTSRASARSEVELLGAPPPSPIQQLEDVLDQYKTEQSVDVSATGDNETSGKLTLKFDRGLTAVAATAGGGHLDPLLPEPYEFDLSILSIPDTLITQIVIAVFSKENPAGSLPGVKVMQIGSSDEYEVVDDYTYQFRDYKITVPKGFRYDRASIPRIFWVVIDKDSLSNVAPLFHDLLYRYGGKLAQNQVSPYKVFTRDDADELFLELMTKCGVMPLRRETAYKIVRAFAKSHWNGQ